MEPVSDALPGFLWIKAVLAVPAVAIGVIPWVVISMTGLQAPRGVQPVWLLNLLLLVLLWVVLLIQLVADGLRFLQTGADHLTTYGTMHVGFRAIESLGVVAAPVTLHVVASHVAPGPSAHGVGAIGGLFVIIGVLAANAVVVVLHTGWLLGVGYDDRLALDSAY